MKFFSPMNQRAVDRRVAWAVAEMERRMADVDLSALADSVNLSRSRFSHLFADHTGLSPARYLRALRMEHARILLERTFLTVKQVMAHVGVTDASHFSRDFRRYHSVLPRTVRDVRRDDAQRSSFLTRHFALVEAGLATPAAVSQRCTPTDSSDGQ